MSHTNAPANPSKKKGQFLSPARTSIFLTKETSQTGIDTRKVCIITQIEKTPQNMENKEKMTIDTRKVRIIQFLFAATVSLQKNHLYIIKFHNHLKSEFKTGYSPEKNRHYFGMKKTIKI